MTFVQQLVYRLLNDTGDPTLSKGVMMLVLIQTSARSGELELVNKTQAKVHIPFLFMGRGDPNNPHLETGLGTSRPRLFEDDGRAPLGRRQRHLAVGLATIGQCE